MDVFVGIDPGKKGAICFLSEENKTLIIDWPKTDNVSDMIDTIERSYEDTTCHGEMETYSFANNVTLAVLEKVSAMPKQGVTSVFSFGQNYGMWLAICAFYSWPTQLITPVQWRKGIITPKDGSTTKIANYNVASRLYPHIKSELNGKRGGLLDGRVDALLMAHKAKMICQK